MFQVTEKSGEFIFGNRHRRMCVCVPCNFLARSTKSREKLFIDNPNQWVMRALIYYSVTDNHTDFTTFHSPYKTTYYPNKHDLTHMYYFYFLYTTSKSRTCLVYFI